MHIRHVDEAMTFALNRNHSPLMVGFGQASSKWAVSPSVPLGSCFGFTQFNPMTRVQKIESTELDKMREFPGVTSASK